MVKFTIKIGDLVTLISKLARNLFSAGIGCAEEKYHFRKIKKAFIAVRLHLGKKRSSINKKIMVLMKPLFDHSIRRCLIYYILSFLLFFGNQNMKIFADRHVCNSRRIFKLITIFKSRSRAKQEVYCSLNAVLFIRPRRRISQLHTFSYS